MEKTIKVLQCLQEGMQVVLDLGRSTATVAYDAGDGRIYMVAKHFGKGQDISDWESGTEVYLNFDLPINSFMQVCENLSEEQMDKMQLDLSVNRVLKGGRKRGY
ncbi:hypothetical protein Goe2_c04000 [Bacillus phage vB_BsuM-Goe2]|uniref:Uncharacterized protein n=1 Tax=Bacillus phage vB_BsuM-Goe2 TaxID=1933062 RepID=A0A217EQH5_9CAUD|nr:hypothetical protein Goe2_c04000 [Bacillus phage vB_BsuM-Goe2]